jgi:DNA helicase-2/ATP-dependent DNA helicase PcrA
MTQTTLAFSEQNTDDTNSSHNTNVYTALAQAELGYLTAPAGCGKTEAIMRSVRDYETTKPQLILTHTNAGVHALERRFLKYEIPKSKYVIDTIASWILGWVKAYPENAEYSLPTDKIPQNDEWNQVYIAGKKLLTKDFMHWVIANSYSGILVDEYQDCTSDMHEMLFGLNGILPIRILGDPLQGIFMGDLVSWNKVRTDYANDLGILATPYRWQKEGTNAQLGQWLLTIRDDIGQITRSNFSFPNIAFHTTSSDRISAKFTEVINGIGDGTICIIGPNQRQGVSLVGKGLTTTLLKRKFTLLEPEHLPTLQKFIDESDTARAAYTFIEDTFCGEGFNETEKKFLKGCLGQITHNVTGNNDAANKKKRIREKYGVVYSPVMMHELLERLEKASNVHCRFQESVYTLKKVLVRQMQTQTQTALKACYEAIMSARRHRKRHTPHRVIGKTLLLKGLEYDHAIIYYSDTWGTDKDMYVALTRACRTITVIRVQ